MLYYTRFFLGYSNKIWAEGTMGKVHAPGGGGYWLCGHLVVLTSPAPPPARPPCLGALSALLWGCL